MDPQPIDVTDEFAVEDADIGEGFRYILASLFFAPKDSCLFCPKVFLFWLYILIPSRMLRRLRFLLFDIQQI